MKNTLLTLFLIHLGLVCFSQDGMNVNTPAGEAVECTTVQPPFEVHRVFAPLSITKETLLSATTLMDLNAYYKDDWVREYIAVEIVTLFDGMLKKAVNKEAKLSKEQKENMNAADIGSPILVNVKYIPENTLINNEMKEFDFKFTVDPEHEAHYEGGQEALNQYLKKHAIEKIPAQTFTGYDLAIIKFTVDETGEISHAEVFQSSNHESIDSSLAEVIRKLPRWTPAAYANGKKVSQEFALTVGNTKNCMMNLVNIHRDRPALADEE